MKLSLRNIGKIDEATVEIDGITIIAGENNTGKSTVGRALFSVFNSFCGIDGKIKLERIKSVEGIIDLTYRNITDKIILTFDTEDIARNIVERSSLFKNDVSLIRDEVAQSIMQYGESFEKYADSMDMGELAVRIQELLNVPDENIFKSVLEKKLTVEFNGQVSNIYYEVSGEICLQIKDKAMAITVEENDVTDITGIVNLRTEVVYLDDPLVLDGPQYPFMRHGPNYIDHRTDIEDKLLYHQKKTNVVEELAVNHKFQKIYDKIATVCSGEIVKNKPSRFDYKRKNSDKTLDVRNLSTGMKTFAILKVLLQNGTIDYNGTIVLDEPEIHLHPEWQLLFAELIVLLHKEFKMHILLNTHSPYFLRAIQVYSAKYEVADRCKYYLAEAAGDYAHIFDVTDDVERIYVKLSRPLQRLEDERWQDD